MSSITQSSDGQRSSHEIPKPDSTLIVEHSSPPSEQKTQFCWNCGYAVIITSAGIGAGGVATAVFSPLSGSEGDWQSIAIITIVSLTAMCIVGLLLRALRPPQSPSAAVVLQEQQLQSALAISSKDDSANSKVSASEGGAQSSTTSTAAGRHRLRQIGPAATAAHAADSEWMANEERRLQLQRKESSRFLEQQVVSTIAKAVIEASVNGKGFSKEQEDAIKNELERLLAFVQKTVTNPPLLPQPRENLIDRLRPLTRYEEMDASLKQLMREGGMLVQANSQALLRGAAHEFVHEIVIVTQEHLLGQSMDVTQQATSAETLIQKYLLQEGGKIQLAFPEETARATDGICRLVSGNDSGIVLLPTLKSNPHYRVLVKTLQHNRGFSIAKFEQTHSLNTHYTAFNLLRDHIDRFEILERNHYQYWTMKSERIFAIPLNRELPCLCFNASAAKITGADTKEIESIYAKMTPSVFET